MPNNLQIHLNPLMTVWVPPATSVKMFYPFFLITLKIKNKKEDKKNERYLMAYYYLMHNKNFHIHLNKLQLPAHPRFSVWAFVEMDGKYYLL